MRFARVKSYPWIEVYCCRCDRLRTRESLFELWADLEGEPFEAYYCSSCKDALEQEYTSPLDRSSQT